MNYTVSDLQKDAKRRLTTSDPSVSLDFYGALLEGKRKMNRKIAPPETVRTAYMEEAIYGDLEKLAVPPDINYDNVIEVKKLKSYRNSNIDTMEHELEVVYRKRFNQNKPGSRNIMTINYVNGLKTASIKKPTGLRSRQLLVDDFDSLDKTGIYNFGGNVVNLTIDNKNYIQGNGSIKFDFNNSSTDGFIEKTLSKALDIKDFLQVGAVFAGLSVSMPKDLISVRLRLYSSDTAYYDYTVNAPHNDINFIKNWNSLKFYLDNQYSTDNPNPREIIKYRIDFVTTGISIPEMRLDSMFARTGQVYEMTYQSSYSYIDAETGEWKFRPEKATDILPYEDDSYQVYMLECTLVLQKELYANNAAGKADVSSVENELEIAYSDYFMNHKSEVIEPTQSTYIFGDYMNGYDEDPFYGFNNHDFDEDYYNNN